MADLKRRREELKEKISGTGQNLASVQEGLLQKNGEKIRAEKDIDGYREKLEQLTEGFTANADLEAEVQEALTAQAESTYRSQKNRELMQLKERNRKREKAV